MILRVLFGDLCTRLQNTKPHDIIRIFGADGKQVYQSEKVLNVAYKRNNLFIVGQALRNLLSEGKFHFSFEELVEYRTFIEVDGIAIRKTMADLFIGQKT